MGVRAKWTLRLEGLETTLALGPQAQAPCHQAVQVHVVVHALTPDEPEAEADCLDQASICDWIVHRWPQSPPTPLLETRINELLQYLFELDKRVQDAWVGLYRSHPPGGGLRVGVERQVSRSQFQSRLRLART